VRSFVHVQHAHAYLARPYGLVLACPEYRVHSTFINRRAAFERHSQSEARSRRPAARRGDHHRRCVRAHGKRRPFPYAPGSRGGARSASRRLRLCRASVGRGWRRAAVERKFAATAVVDQSAYRRLRTPPPRGTTPCSAAREVCARLETSAYHRPSVPDLPYIPNARRPGQHVERCHRLRRPSAAG